MPSFPVEGLTEVSRRVLVAAGAPDDIADQFGALAGQLEPGGASLAWVSADS